MKKHFSSLICVSVLLMGCADAHRFIEFRKYTYDRDTYEFIQGEGYYKPSKYSIDFTEVYQDYPYSSDKQINTPSTGNRKLLVIPIEFKDKACSTLLYGCEGTRAQIQNAFFGADSKNTFKSVTSYFNQSSFGKLHLKGKVSDWYKSQYTIEDMKTQSNSVDTIVKEACDWYKRNNQDFKSFDTDKDGFLDGVVFIYGANFERDTPLWAYKASTKLNSNKEDPRLKSYVWASYNFMSTNTFSVDAHTYIHEVGHLFGLQDYYSDDRKQVFQPIGGMDMMDYNIGDHNTYSKMLLNWTRPYVVTDNAKITINASYKNGDCILIPAGTWNGSAMDEYLLIELYSPYGLNKYDSKVTYTNGIQEFSLMNKPGIKVMHVDARIAYYMTISTKSGFIGYLGDEGLEETLAYYREIGQPYFRQIDHFNDLSKSNNELPLLELIDRHGPDYLKSGAIANNDSLFKVGGKISDFDFNNGEKLGFEIEIISLSSQKAELSFTKK